MKTYNILSLDGGGLRGLITTTLLERIEAAAPGFLANASLIVGTSTGGILALALAQGLAPYRIMRMYLDDGPQIFHRSLGRKIGSLLGLREAKYNNDGLKKALQEVFGDSKLKDLGKRVAVTAFKLDDQTTFPPTWRPKIFHNYPGEDSDGEERVVNVALRTANAPTFFPSSDGYVDGGTFAGNPSVVALAQALDPRSQLGKMRDLSCIRLLSVGTGENATYLPGGRLDWGVGQWAMPLVNILLDGVAGIADFQCRQILREKYFRLQVELPEDKKIPMDSVNDLSLMLGIGQQSPIRPAVQWLRDQGWT
jgi:patatin-like phospholipase/acyl hydrolase